jgi:hypothetical protein
MRPNQQNNKNRSRGRNGGRKHVNPLSRNYESNGPDVKVRGNAAHIAEKYTQLARDAQSSGDSVMAENYLQHAEHYYRIVMAAQPQQFRQDNAQDNDDDFDGDESETENRAPHNANNTNASANAERQSGNDAGESQRPAEAAATGEAAPAETGEGNDGEPARKRRPRRRRPSGSETAAADQAGAPQPEVGDLPAFITAGGAAAE